MILEHRLKAQNSDWIFLKFGRLVRVEREKNKIK